MAIQISPMKITLYLLIMLEFARDSCSREMPENGVLEVSEAEPLKSHQEKNHVARDLHQLMEDQMDGPVLHIFFTLEDMKVGNSMPIYFPLTDPSTSPRLLPKQEADSIPFSSSQLPYLLDLFSFSKDSPQAKAIENTLYMCEMEPFEGETRICATSLESMLDFVRATFGPDSHFKALTTNFLSNPTSQLLNYTVLEEPKEVVTTTKIGCHTFPYPYVVYFCHTHDKRNKIFQVLLKAEDDVKVEALTICHMDTSKWDKDHISFQALRIAPGTHHVCHFFPKDNLIWIPSSA